MKTGWLWMCIFLAGELVMAQSSDRMARTEYFNTYSEIAVREMHRSGVPASITLAQGALESGDGNSRLARNANNHFGIKCHNDWNGKKVYHDDDAKGECFRKYQSAEESYRDHSDYLRKTTRYAFLFDLDPADYKSWARGLKRAGYATSHSYAESLIRIIEEFGLQQYDGMAETGRLHDRKTRHTSRNFSTRTIQERNRVKYIVAGSGDTYELLTQEFGKLAWELPSYNDAQTGDSLVPGDVIYIQPKRNRAGTGRNVHILQPGETMYTVSQLYAIKLSSLYAMNLLNPGIRPSEGTSLQLRKALRRPILKPVPDETPEGGEEEEEIKVELNLE